MKEEINAMIFDADDHIGTDRIDTPLRPDAFDLSNEQKMDAIQFHFKEIMNVLGLDLTDESLQGTPARVAKMYVEEIFSGLDPRNKPKIALFENKFRYNQMLVEKDITFYSNCEHHFVPIIGKASVAYISSGKIIGLSKIHRIVNYFAKRPQVQERLIKQISNELMELLQTENVAVYIEATHMCVSSRGIKDTSSTTITTDFNGLFLNEEKRQEFLKLVK